MSAWMQPLGPANPAMATESWARPVPRMAFWLSILLVCLLPIQRFMLPFGFSLADVVLVLLIVFTAVWMWLTEQPLAFPLLLPMWLILTSSVIATLVGIRHVDSVVAVAQELYLFASFLALANLWRVLSRRDLDRLMKVWVIVAGLETLLALAGMFKVGPSVLYTKPSQTPEAAYEIVRAVGTHANANAAAVYLSVSYFVALATSWPLRVRVLAAAWLFCGLYATGSNGALLSTAFGTAVALLAFAILTNWRRLILFGGLACCLIILALTIVLFGGQIMTLIPHRLLASSDPLLFQTVGRFGHSLENRVAIIGWAWELYRHYPWGIGPNGFSTIQGSLHNDYMAFWFERGPLGLIGWLWLIVEVLTRPFTNLHLIAPTHRQWQLIALGAGFLATAVNAFSHEVSHMRQVWFLVALLFALSLAAGDALRRSPAGQFQVGRPSHVAPGYQAR
jgi:hypothetical protein